MNKFLDLLREGKRPIQASLGAPSALMAEMVGKLGFDSVMIDYQHGMMSFSDVYSMLVALGTTSATPMVRIPWNDPAAAMGVLDAGALGVICPMVSSRKEAEKFVAACRYPPAGMRSLGPTRAGIARFAEYLKTANQDIMVIAQIETAEGFENTRAIATTPGLDAVFPGPSDLALAFGEPLSFDYKSPAQSKMSARLREIIDVAHDSGIKVMMPVADAKGAEEVLRWGADWICVGPEWTWMLAGGTRILEETRAASKAFGPSHEQ
jgi:4-hydroxy-2-oxoheptanedioate aldolase